MTEKPSPISSATTVSYEAFLDLYKQVNELTKQIEMLEAIIIPEWLNRRQAMAYLQCSTTKLWGLQQQEVIEYTYNGNSPLYSYKSCKAYLKSRDANKQLLDFHLKQLLSFINSPKNT